MNLAQVLEGVMLACFGIAWPIANVRMLRTRRPEGKGLPFTLIILCGYLCGTLAKLVLAQQGEPLAPVFWLYLLNTSSVATNLALQYHLGRRALAQVSAGLVANVLPLFPDSAEAPTPPRRVIGAGGPRP